MTFTMHNPTASIGSFDDKCVPEVIPSEYINPNINAVNPRFLSDKGDQSESRDPFGMKFDDFEAQVQFHRILSTHFIKKISYDKSASEKPDPLLPVLREMANRLNIPWETV